MNFSELFPLQAVINLDKRPDRLKISMEEEFPKIGITPLRKPGYVFDRSDNNWWNGAIGCMISHYQVLSAAQNWESNVFIFEDDVSFIGEDVKNTLDKACNQLGEVEWDMFYIGGNLLKPCYQVSDNLAKLTHCQSTVAYGVNKKFLPTILEYLANGIKNITRPIDMIYADTVIPNHNCYISIPMLAIQRDSYSDIEGKEVKYTDYLEERYWSNLVKKI